MAYVNWVIGGLTPSWVEPDFNDDRENHKLTLKCAAIRDRIGVDPVTELDQFNNISSEGITNTSLENGGTNLQVTDGQIISVTADETTWDRCALHAVNVQTDDGYNGDNPGSVLEYELVIEYEVRKGGGVFIFTPPLHEYTEIEYYIWTDKTNDLAGPWLGNEFGWMKFTLPKPVKAITFYGSACLLPATIFVPGSNEGRREWTSSHDDNKNLPDQEQKFTFDPATAPSTIIAYTSDHLIGDINHGCWAKWIRVEYI